jgi:hypothetical protein
MDYFTREPQVHLLIRTLPVPAVTRKQSPARRLVCGCTFGPVGFLNPDPVLIPYIQTKMIKLDLYYQLQDPEDSEVLYDLCLEQNLASLANCPPAYLSGSGHGSSGWSSLGIGPSWSVFEDLGISGRLSGSGYYLNDFILCTSGTTKSVMGKSRYNWISTSGNMSRSRTLY